MVCESERSASGKPRIDSLFEKGKEYKSVREAKAEEKVKRELESCTFKPIISGHSSSIVQPASRRTNSDIHEMLYEDATRRLSRERKGKSTLDVEFEKGAAECTFKPNTQKPNILNLTLTHRQPLSALKSASNNYSHKRNYNQLKTSVSQATLGVKKNSFAKLAKPKSALKKQARQEPPTQYMQPEILTSPQTTFSPPSSDTSILQLNSSHQRSFGLLQQHVNRLTDVIQAARMREDQILSRNLLLISPTSPNPLPLESKQPVLFLEVNIGGDRPPGKLLLYDGDQPEEIVQVFANAYSLTESKRIKLLTIVRDQLAKIL